MIEESKKGSVFKSLIKTGGEVADKMLDKGADVVGDMMEHVTGLISKLSDDIGVMANRIMTMEERIGLMADRIVKTEELMAKLTATLANKELPISSEESPGKDILKTTLLDITGPAATSIRGPKLKISTDPESYLLFVSRDPLFQESGTVVSHINKTFGYDMAWQRSIDAFEARMSEEKQNQSRTLVVYIAVKALDKKGQASAISNSVEVTVDLAPEAVN